MLRQRALCTILALAAAMPARAQSSYVDIEQRLSADEMHEAGLDTLSPAQLAALNLLLRAKPAPSTPIAPMSATAASPATTAPESGRSYIGLDDKPIRSRVKGSVSGWEPGTVFELENGQQWKVLKGSMKLRTPRQAPEIVLV